MKAESKNWSLLTASSPETRERVFSEFVEAQVALAAPRHLLAGLRDIMTGAAPAAAKLDEVVRLVARELRADVCSCFVARAGDLLELFATAGLSADLVHKSRIRVGEGLVGDIA